MKRFIFLCLAALTSSSLFAVLPPLYQSIREIKTILRSEELPRVLTSSELIESISRTDRGYEIITTTKRLEVDIIYLPAERMGPARFDLQFNDPLPRK